MSTLSFCRCIALAASLLLILPVCRPASEPVDSYLGRVAVTRYNQALVQAYRAQRADLLQDVATAAEISRVGAFIAGLSRDGRFMVATQISFHVDVTATPNERRMTVDTVEEWSYEHRELATPASPAATKTVTYRLRYELQRNGARWKTDRIRMLE